MFLRNIIKNNNAQSDEECNVAILLSSRPKPLQACPNFASKLQSLIENTRFNAVNASSSGSKLESGVDFFIFSSIINVRNSL